MLPLHLSLLKENELPPFVGRSLFLYACVAPFSCQKPLGVSVYFNNFLFLIQFWFLFICLFIYSLHQPGGYCVWGALFKRATLIQTEECWWMVVVLDCKGRLWSEKGYVVALYEWTIYLKHQVLNTFVEKRKISYFGLARKFISTLNFTQSGWLILFSPDPHFRLAKRVSGQTHSLWLETATTTDVPLVVPA